MNAWLKLAWQHPALLTAHAAGYAALAADEAGLAWGSAVARVRRQLVIGACLAVGTILAGTAVLLWAALPALPMGRVWWLVVVPLLPFLAAALAWQRRQAPDEAFAGLRAQLALDHHAWEGAGALERHPAAQRGRP